MTGLPRSWYPLMCARDLSRGAVRRVDLSGIALAVFRTHDGQVGALAARCAHAGADLAHGQVTESCLRCPLHHRCYSAAGISVIGPVQRAYPITERWGIVFAWLGGDPVLPLPSPDGVADGLITAVQEYVVEAPVELIAANAFDTDHLSSVHQRKLKQPAELVKLSEQRIRIIMETQVVGTSLREWILRVAGLDTLRIETDCWGGNMLFFHHRRFAACALLMLRPDTALRSVGYFLTLRARPSGVLAAFMARVILTLQHRAFLAFAEQDRHVLAGAQNGTMQLDPERDACVASFFDHWRRLPIVTEEPR